MNMSKYSQIYPYHPNRHAAYIFNYVILAFSLHSKRRYVYFHFFSFSHHQLPSSILHVMSEMEWGSKNCGRRGTFCGLVKFWRAYFHHWNTLTYLNNILTTWPKLLWRPISVEHEIILRILEGFKIKPPHSLLTEKNSCEKAQFCVILNIKDKAIFLKNTIFSTSIHLIFFSFIGHRWIEVLMNSRRTKKKKIKL